MANIYTSADQLIGKTPLLEHKNRRELGLKARVSSNSSILTQLVHVKG